METKLAKLEVIIPTLVTREDLAKHSTDIMERIDRMMAIMRSDIDRKFITCIGIQMTTLFAMIGLLSKIANII